MIPLVNSSAIYPAAHYISGRIGISSLVLQTDYPGITRPHCMMNDALHRLQLQTGLPVNSALPSLTRRGRSSEVASDARDSGRAHAASSSVHLNHTVTKLLHRVQLCYCLTRCRGEGMLRRAKTRTEVQPSLTCQRPTELPQTGFLTPPPPSSALATTTTCQPSMTASVPYYRGLDL